MPPTRVPRPPGAGDPPDAAGSPDPAGPHAPAAEPLLPLRSQDDTDAGWGEPPEPDDDERLRRDRPPHWEAG